MKRKYIATFADGSTVTRGTEHSYAVAWRATYDYGDGRGPLAQTGFAASREKANPYRPQYDFRPRRFMSSNERAKVAKRQAEYLKEINYSVEFAEAVPQ